MRGLLRDPAGPSFLLFGAIVVAGLVTLAFGWHEVAYTVEVGRQVPAIISAGIGGLVLVLIGAGLVTVQAGRRLAALERAETEALLDIAAGLVAARKEGRR